MEDALFDLFELGNEPLRRPDRLVRRIQDRHDPALLSIGGTGISEVYETVQLDVRVSHCPESEKRLLALEKILTDPATTRAQSLIMVRDNMTKPVVHRHSRAANAGRITTSIRQRGVSALKSHIDAKSLAG